MSRSRARSTSTSGTPSPTGRRSSRRRRPEGAPSVVYIVLDDVGFSAMSCYGGPIETPNIDAIAADGVRYQQWHTTALCSPTRSCLLTGRNHTRNSMACITEAAIGFPNASGTIPPENGTLPEILGELGWNTYMVGKWHLCPDDEMNLASTRRNWPTGRGFERWYGFLGAETNQWYPDLVYDNHNVDQPTTPEEGYHLTVDLTDKAIEFIRDAKAIAPEKPFFLYYVPGACHAPHHAPKAWIDKYKGRFDLGYEALRDGDAGPPEGDGHRPAGHRAAADQPDRHPRDAHRPRRQAVPGARRDAAVGLAVRRREGAVRPHGRGLRRVPRPRRLRDRAAARLPGGVRLAGEHDGRRRLRQRRLRRGRPERLGERDEVRQRHPRHDGGQPAAARRARQPDDLQPLPERVGDGVQHAVQDVEALRVQRRHQRPVHHLVAGRHDGARRAARAVPPRRRPRARRSSTCSASRPPATIKGHAQSRFDGVSMRYSFDDAAAPTTRRTQFYSMLGSRGIWHDGWKAITNHPTLSGWSHFNDDEWELYHVDVDRSELHDLAAEHPEKVRELVNLWYAEAGANGAFPLDDRSALEIMLTPRPVLSPPRNRYIYFPDAADVPESQAVNVRNRSFTIGALVDIPARRGAGRAVRPRLAVRRPRPVRQGRPAALRLQLRRDDRGARRRRRRHPDRRRPDPVGLVRQGRRRSARRRERDAVAVARRDQGGRGPAQDPARQVHDRRRGPVHRPRQRRRVTADTPASCRRFTGGTIRRVAVDVSGEPFSTSSTEAAAMLMRE